MRLIIMISSVVLVISSTLAAAVAVKRQTGEVVNCTCLNDLILRTAQAESQTNSTYTCYYGSSDKGKAEYCSYDRILGNLVATNMNHCDTEAALPCF